MQGNLYNGNGYIHWKESDAKLNRDLMSSLTLEGYNQKDMKYTLAALKDMGFNIDEQVFPK